MMSSPIPQNYDEWQHCITVECGIPLTQEFVTQRLAVWRDESLEETRRFKKLYGDAYLQSVVGWFEEAERRLAAS
ncbi:MAG: hypothetical protein AAGG55_05230 [Pseudomonadota bacterium]